MTMNSISAIAMGCKSLTLSGLNMDNIGFDEFATHCFDKEQFPSFQNIKIMKLILPWSTK